MSNNIYRQLPVCAVRVLVCVSRFNYLSVWHASLTFRKILFCRVAWLLHIQDLKCPIITVRVSVGVRGCRMHHQRDADNRTLTSVFAGVKRGKICRLKDTRSQPERNDNNNNLLRVPRVDAVC